MGIQDPVSTVSAKCDETGCAESMMMLPAVFATTNAELAYLFALVGWLITSSKKVYCPKHKAGKK